MRSLGIAYPFRDQKGLHGSGGRRRHITALERREGNGAERYDPHSLNKRDVPGEILPTITTSHTIGQCGVTLIFEYEVQDDRIIAD